MRILSICYEYPPVGGGGATVASALNAQLAANGHRVEVVTSGMKGLLASEFSSAKPAAGHGASGLGAGGPSAGSESPPGVWIHRAPCWRRHRHYTTAPELATTLLPAFFRANALIRRQMPDVIHAHFALPSGLVARALSARHGIPYVLTAHGSDIPGYNPDRFDLLHRALKPVWRSVMHGAAAVVSPSQFLASLIRTHVDVAVQVIANGYDSDASSANGASGSSGDSSANGDGAPPEANLPRPRRNLILVVARLFPRKGVQHFIDSVAALGEDWEMVVAGDGPYLSELRTRATNANAHIRFAGFVGKTELRRLYEEARILVFPSIRENFPMVLLEGMDAGCAVITTDAEGCAEVVGNAGVVIEKGKPAPLRAALLDLMNDPVRCEALGALAMARAERFRWPRIAGHYERVFDAVAKRMPLRSLALDPPAAP